MDRRPVCPTERVKNYKFSSEHGLSTNHPKPKSNDVDSQEDSYLYLSAMEEKMIASENSNGSFLAHQHANKKIYKNVPYRRF